MKDATGRELTAESVAYHQPIGIRGAPLPVVRYAGFRPVNGRPGDPFLMCRGENGMWSFHPGSSLWPTPGQARADACRTIFASYERHHRLAMEALAAEAADA